MKISPKFRFSSEQKHIVHLNICKMLVVVEHIRTHDLDLTFTSHLLFLH